ncbi:MAG: hypothetical protein IJS28_10640 [Synergistaceae bacterium]|nr:hypothetical protein [Synergistaceae bacterium]
MKELILNVCTCSAVYKSANLQELLRGFRAVRIDYAGIPELERVTDGEEALSDIHCCLSIILLWRD